MHVSWTSKMLNHSLISSDSSDLFLAADSEVLSKRSPEVAPFHPVKIADVCMSVPPGLLTFEQKLTGTFTAGAFMNSAQTFQFWCACQRKHIRAHVEHYWGYVYDYGQSFSGRGGREKSRRRNTDSEQGGTCFAGSPASAGIKL